MTGVDVFIFAAVGVGICFAAYNFAVIQRTKVNPGRTYQPANSPLIAVQAELAKVEQIHATIDTGAKAFLRAEYTICVQFLLAFSVLLLILTTVGSSFAEGLFTTVAFLVGGFTSIASGLCGMLVAVDANARTTVAAASEPPSRLTAAFNVAFRAGAVMGFALCALGLGVLLALLLAYRVHFSDVSEWATMMDCVAGFGLGGSSVAMFGRVGGGIYTKAADVGADLVGKVVHGLEEDDPKNPATIADNVGDNVGDVAGMGSDLFGSLAESTCAALVIASTSSDLLDAGWAALLFPLTISAAGILVCMACSFIATDLKPAVREADVESALKLQLISTTFLVVPVVVYLAHALLPDKFELPSVVSGTIKASSTGAAICVSVGALGGLLIGLVTEYYTSHSYEPVRECAHVCKQGAAVNLIYGLALGYRSAIVPVYTLAAIVYFAFSLADLYGVALAALGMLSTLATGLTIDGYGPVTDNAGGIAEMAQLPAACREKTDCLDACVCGVPFLRLLDGVASTPSTRRLDAVDATPRHRRRDLTYLRTQGRQHDRRDREGFRHRLRRVGLPRFIRRLRRPPGHHDGCECPHPSDVCCFVSWSEPAVLVQRHDHEVCRFSGGGDGPGGRAPVQGRPLAAGSQLHLYA